MHTTYTQARANLAKLCDQVTEDREVVIITRRGGGDVALIAADELAGILETLHLLRSPKNADRLLGALKDAQARRGRRQTAESLRQEVGLDRKTTETVGVETEGRGLSSALSKRRALLG